MLKCWLHVADGCATIRYAYPICGYHYLPTYLPKRMCPMTDSAPMQALRATVSRCVDEGAPVLTEVPARMMSGRCVHGLKAGLCNTCPTLDREPDGRWIWRAVPVRNGARNRRFMIGGFLHMVNRHGVVLREDAGNAGDGWRAVSFDWDDETTLAAKLAIDRTGIRPSCSPGYSFCRCAPRW